MQDLLIMRGRAYVPEEPEPEPNVLPGSCVAFTCNGELQGVAYRSVTTSLRPCLLWLMILLHSSGIMSLTFCRIVMMRVKGSSQNVA